MSRKKLRIAAAALGILMATTQSAMSAENLFKDYAYGSPIAKYGKSTGFYDCSKDAGATARCLDGVDFLGAKFDAVLGFDSGELQTVALVAPYNNEKHIKTMGALSKTFTLVAMSDGKSILDLIDLASNETKEKYTAKLKSFETLGASSGNLSYTFYDGKHSLTKKMTAYSLLTSLPIDTRAAELIVREIDDAADLMIRFSFPQLEEKKAKDIMTAEVESF